MDIEYTPGTTQGKIKVFLFLLFLLSIYLLISYAWHTFLPEPKDLDDSIYKYAEDVADANVYTSIFMLCLYLYAANVCYRFGKRIKQNEQYPPPNAQMPFKMRIVRGKQAIKQAYAAYATSFLLVIFGVYKLGFSLYYANVMYGLNIAF